MEKGTFGIVGLGKMGLNLALQAIDKKYQIIGFDPYTKEDIKQSGIRLMDKLDELISQLPVPRIIFIYIPAGKAVDDLLEQLMGLMNKGDIIVDGGNSYWGDSIRRNEKLRSRN